MMTTAAALTSNSRDVTGLAGAAASAAHRDSVGSGSGQTGEDGLRPGQRGGGRESLSLLLGSGSQAMLQGTSFGTGGLGSGLKLGPSGGAAMLGDAGPGRLQAFKALAGAAAAAAAVDLPHAALAAARPLHATPVALPEVASLGSPNAIIRSSVGFPAAPSSLLRDALEGRSRGTSEGGTRAGSGSSGAGRGAASTSVVSGGVSAVLGPAAGAGASGSGLLMLGPVGQVGVVETMPDEVWLRMVPPRYAQQPEWVAQVQVRGVRGRAGQRTRWRCSVGQGFWGRRPRINEPELRVKLSCLGHATWRLSQPQPPACRHTSLASAPFRCAPVHAWSHQPVALS